MTKPFKSKSVQATDVHGYPEPLMRESAPHLIYPVDALGALLGPMAKAVQRATETPMALCGSSVLAAAALAVQPYADVMLDGRVFPLSLDILSVGYSGERKTSIDRCVLAPFKGREEKMWEQYLDDAATYEVESVIRRTEREAVLKDKNRSEDAKRIDLLAIPEPVRPMRPHIIIENATIEALLRHLRDDMPSVGLFSSEGGMFLGGYSMRKEQTLATIAALSRLWDGSPVPRSTVSDFENTMPLFGRRLSCHLMIQARVAMKLLGDDEIQDQGILSRFLICWPESTIGTRFDENTLRIDQSADAALYSSRITKILEIPLPLSEKIPGKLEPRQLKCSGEAYRLWKTFNRHVERRMANDGAFFLLRNFVNKAPENAARVAGVLTLIDDIDAKDIPGDKMNNAVSLMEFHIQEIARAFCQGSVGDELHRAQSLLDWINEKGHKHIYPELVYRLGPPMFRTKDKAMVVLDVLEHHGHLMRMDDGFVVDGKPRKLSWQVVHATDAQEQ